MKILGHKFIFEFCYVYDLKIVNKVNDDDYYQDYAKSKPPRNAVGLVGMLALVSFSFIYVQHFYNYASG